MAGRLPVLSPLRAFLRTEAGGGVLLLAATVAALAWANSPWADSYQDFWHTSLSIGPGSWAVREDLQHWVNDALMLVFFFLIGLEIKRELIVGELRDPKAASLPALAALGGMVVPAVLFLALAGGGEAGRDWAIPIATDIVFVGEGGDRSGQPGLVAGKVCGITAVAWGATRVGAGRLPPGVGMNHVLGTSALGGIGFTVSLFIAGLAFTSEELQMPAKIGILAGSFIAAIIGVAILLAQSAPAADEAVPAGETAAV